MPSAPRRRSARAYVDALGSVLAASRAASIELGPAAAAARALGDPARAGHARPDARCAELPRPCTGSSCELDGRRSRPLRGGRRVLHRRACAPAPADASRSSRSRRTAGRSRRASAPVTALGRPRRGARRGWRGWAAGNGRTPEPCDPAPPHAAPGGAAAARTITVSGASRRTQASSPTSRTSTAARRRTHPLAIVGGGTATGLADAARGIVDAGLSDRALGARRPGAASVHADRAERGLPRHEPRQPGARTSRAPRSTTSGTSEWARSGYRTARSGRRFDAAFGARAVFESDFLAPAHRSPPAARSCLADARLIGLGLRRPRVRTRADCTPSPYEGVPCTRARSRRHLPGAPRARLRHPRAAARRARALPALGPARRHREAGDRDALRLRS